MAGENFGSREQGPINMFRKCMIGFRRVTLGIIAGSVLAGCTGNIDGTGIVTKPDLEKPSTPITQPEKNIADEISMAGSKYEKEIRELKTHNPDAEAILEGAHIETRTKDMGNGKVLFNIREDINQKFKDSTASIVVQDGDFMLVTSYGLDDFHADTTLSTRSIEVNYIADSTMPITVLLSGSDAARHYIVSKITSGEALSKGTETDFERNITIEGVQLKDTHNFMKGLLTDDIMDDSSSKLFGLVDGKLIATVPPPTLEDPQLNPYRAQ